MTNESIKPAEASLLDDPATADLAAKVKQAWAEFGQALTDALATLPYGAGLDITLDPTAAGVADAVYDVSVSAVENGQLHADAVSNAMLPPEYRLPRSVIGELVELGWSPPGIDSDDRFNLTLPVNQAGRVAAIVTRTFRDAYGSPHPAFLRYRIVLADSGPATGGPGAGEPSAAGAGEAAPAAIEGQLTAAEVASEPAAEVAEVPSEPAPQIPTLGAARPLLGDDEGPEVAVDLSVLPLPEKVAAVIAAMLKTTPENLPLDKDGDIGIRSGSAMVFVRVRDNPPLVDVFSPVLTGVDASEQLYVKLSELTHRMPIGRLYCTGETVWASVPVFGRDFQPTHLMLAVQVMTGLADELDDRLHGEFGGKRFWVDTDRPGVEPSPADHTGFYI